MSPSVLESLTEWNLFAERFAAGVIEKEEWTHGAHLTVAAWYLVHCPREEAGERLRSGIRRLNERLGGQNTATSGFHETLTEFWIEIISRWLAVRGKSLEAVAALVADPAAGSGAWKNCYDFDVVKSERARREWVAPAHWPHLGY